MCRCFPSWYNRSGFDVNYSREDLASDDSDDGDCDDDCHEMGVAVVALAIVEVASPPQPAGCSRLQQAAAAAGCSSSSDFTQTVQSE